MDLFARIVSNFKLMLITILAKRSIVDVWSGLEYAFDIRVFN